MIFVNILRKIVNDAKQSLFDVFIHIILRESVCADIFYQYCWILAVTGTTIFSYILLALQDARF